MAKRLIVCFDGTWNKPETGDRVSYPTNILKFMRALKRSGRDGVSQVVYYQRGVGTANFLDKWLGGVGGFGLSENVLEAYRWLANNYDHPDDEIHLFGFSRGAYSARSLGGLLGVIGMLTKLEVGRLPEGYTYYQTPQQDRPGHAFHATATQQGRVFPRIKCIGVFDTVGALGIPIGIPLSVNRRYQFHDVRLGRHVDNAFQALAIDEFRKPYKPAIWDRPDNWSGRLEQAWFVGAHSNVGGGYQDGRLSDIALRWMISRAMRCGLSFDRAYYRQHISPDNICKGAIGDEMTIFYRIMGPYLRQVSTDAARSLFIHRSVRTRLEDKDLNYRPENIT